MYNKTNNKLYNKMNKDNKIRRENIKTSKVIKMMIVKCNKMIIK